MAKNLKVIHFRDGSEITDVTKDIHGSGWLYTWSAVKSNNLCPSGWHVPSINEWRSLINSLGSLDYAAGKLEERFSKPGEVSHWWSSTEAERSQDNERIFYYNLCLTYSSLFAGFCVSIGWGSQNVRCVRN